MRHELPWGCLVNIYKFIVIHACSYNHHYSMVHYGLKCIENLIVYEKSLKHFCKEEEEEEEEEEEFKQFTLKIGKLPCIKNSHTGEDF